MGSWRNKSAPELFGRTAERVTAHLGDLVPWACTLGEPNLFDLLKQIGAAPAEGAIRTRVTLQPSPGLVSRRWLMFTAGPWRRSGPARVTRVSARRWRLLIFY
jgi:hypothetical protein